MFTSKGIDGCMKYMSFTLQGLQYSTYFKLIILHSLKAKEEAGRRPSAQAHFKSHTVNRHTQVTEQPMNAKLEKRIIQSPAGSALQLCLCNQHTIIQQLHCPDKQPTVQYRLHNMTFCVPDNELNAQRKTEKHVTTGK